MSRKISRSTKLVIGVVIFIVICLIVGLTLYFVLSKKKHSGSTPTPTRHKHTGYTITVPTPTVPTPTGPTPTGPTPAVPTPRSYADAIIKANKIKSETEQYFSNIDSNKIFVDFSAAEEKNDIKAMQNIIVNFLNLYNQSVIQIKSTIQDVNDLYNLIGDFDPNRSSYGEFIYNKNSFKSTLSDFFYTIQNNEINFNESDIRKNTNNSELHYSYLSKISRAYSYIDMESEYIIEITGGIIDELNRK